MFPRTEQGAGARSRLTGRRAGGESRFDQGWGRETRRSLRPRDLSSPGRRGKELAVINKVRIVTAALVGSAALAGCMTMGVQEKEGQLAAAGFVRQQADTPLKVAKLQALPQNTIVLCAAEEGQRLYLRGRRGVQLRLHRQRRGLSAISADPHRQQHRANAGDDGAPEPGSHAGLGRRLGPLRSRLVLMDALGRIAAYGPRLSS